MNLTTCDDFYSRKGSVEVSYEMIRSNAKLLAEAFSGCLVIHVEHRPWISKDTFIMCCDKFDPLEEGEVCPNYLILISENEDGSHEFRFDRE